MPVCRNLLHFPTTIFCTFRADNAATIHWTHSHGNIRLAWLRIHKYVTIFRMHFTMFILHNSSNLFHQSIWQYHIHPCKQAGKHTCTSNQNKPISNVPGLLCNHQSSTWQRGESENQLFSQLMALDRDWWQDALSTCPSSRWVVLSSVDSSIIIGARGRQRLWESRSVREI